eukprot:Clim_evm9s239 gene=Clim_evmTU9s239
MKSFNSFLTALFTVLMLLACVNSTNAFRISRLSGMFPHPLYYPFDAAAKMAVPSFNHNQNARTYRIIEEEDASIITMDVPGFAIGDISLTASTGQLKIAGTHKCRSGDKVCVPRYLNHVINLPNKTDIDNISASFTDSGVLIVSVPHRVTREKAILIDYVPQEPSFEPPAGLDDSPKKIAETEKATVEDMPLDA